MIGHEPPSSSPPEMPMFNHVAWVAEDQSAVVDFLENHFECKAGPPRVIEGAWADELSRMKDVRAIYVGVKSKGTDTHIAVLKFERPPSEHNPEVDKLNLMGLRHFGFLVEDIDAKTAELKKAGYKFFSEIVTVEAFKSKTVYFWGPENAVIQLTEAMG